ncbi:response receiver sensor histidine kinase response regulator, PAS and PAS domain-containing [Citrifermentans bemidjiense Bem]|uniref:histidine kinase n=1 Tax=Citrifermentans bemidjiense (strain ATCC BAA-1014 / DSM 16622 / JCM 12645 / Bem) TaxID=404380 RepID=B5EFV1_CITBB|nr:PAS domain S-box protein [Citrifermentans bemidjiense]ACH39416.1 response receiver sensor histidine kinase response regulator, PAS and PAS domain-containing [Citrifermentans bemidjiense Bem]
MKHALRILIVDDSPEDAALIVRQLQGEFSISYERVETPDEMEAALDKGGWHIVISDYVMPKFSGLAALKLLHDRGMDLPFIMVSGQMGEDAAVEAMRAGAHDYLLKDRLSRLIPAIKRELNDAVVRRERRMAEEALSATEARFHSLVEQSLVGIFMLQDDVFIYVNPKFGEIFAYEPQQLIESRSLLELVAPEDQIRVMTRFLRPLMEESDSLHFFFRGKRRDGSLIDLEVNGTRTRVNGSAAIIGTLLDITERKRAEAELSKLWRAVEQSPVSVVITDLFGRIEYVNPKFIEVTGYAEEELIGKNPSILKSGMTDAKVYEELWSTVTSGREWHGELHNKKKNGELFWENGHISAIKNAEGQITHFVGVKEDVTERKLAIDQLRQVQKMEAIGQLAGGIAHDFNNLLTVINGYSTLLVRSLDKGSPTHKEAEQILRAGERAADLTRQLLSFSRRQIMEPRVLDINKQVRAVQKMLERLIGEHIGLVTTLSEDAGFIRMDPGQMEQIVMNLIVNARDASETGGVITMATEKVDLDQNFSHLHPGSVPGSYVRLSVADQGQGMTEEVKQRLFEPFFTTKEMGRGTGLGLATVYGIVKQSGGYIEVVSEPGQGACFNIYLPRASEPAPAPPAPPVDEEIDSSHVILVVEDEPGVLNLVVHTLRMRGFTVYEATDPDQGITLFEKHATEIDMLLTDVVMPFMSGPALAELLLSKKPGLKVLFTSGHTDDRAGFEKILEKGMQFLPKPFASDALIRKVRDTLNGGTAKTAGAISGGSD